MTAMSAEQILDREFLEIRAKILEIAASFDRLERATGHVEHDPRSQQLVAALKTVLATGSDRAERIQLIFSRNYDQDWQQTMQLQS